MVEPALSFSKLSRDLTDLNANKHCICVIKYILNICDVKNTAYFTDLNSH